LGVLETDLPTIRLVKPSEEEIKAAKLKKDSIELAIYRQDSINQIAKAEKAATDSLASTV